MLLRRIFNIKSIFYLEPFIYLNEIEIPCKEEITNRIRWYEKLQIEAFSEKDAIKIGVKMLHFKYPELRDCFYFI